MMLSYDELLEQLGEAELADISMRFWLDYSDRLDPGRSSTPEAYEALINFQRGWAACKNRYSISD